MDNRPVVVRTDLSADDFWSRVRDSADVSPDFRIRNFEERIRSDTPFGRQRLGLPVVLPPLRSSRSVERLVLRDAVHDAEKENTGANDLEKEVVKLRIQNECLRENLTRALRINHVLTKNMLKSNMTPP
jgi:hypothetical protein